MPDLIDYQQRDTIAVLTLNAPKTRNALSRAMRYELLALLEKIYADEQCSAIVLTGADGHFCSGGDLNDMKEERTLDIARERVAMGGVLSRAMVAGPKPIITAVEGFAAGAGFSVAMASDYVVSSREAVYISSFGKVGLLPDMGMLWSLTQRIGLGQAKRIIASARKVVAEEGFELGLVDQLAEPGTTLEAAIAVAKEFSVAAPLTTAMMKTAYARGVNGLEDALKFELDSQSSLYLTRDHREAVAAFFEKRQPVFKGC